MIVVLGLLRQEYGEDGMGVFQTGCSREAQLNGRATLSGRLRLRRQTG